MMSPHKPAVIHYTDNQGGLAYPFLPAELQWQIVSRPFRDEAALAHIFQAAPPTLRWVKDDKVLDLYVPGLDTDAFLARSGLALSLHHGGYVLSKRLSRIMRPYRYWGFFESRKVTIDYSPELDNRLWDGCGQVSRGFIQRLAEQLDLDERHRRELLATHRFEVTTLHAAGQDKGHVLVVDDLAVDFLFPAGSAKTELALMDGRVFVGLLPVHSDDQMCLDVQSIINLHPFFRPEQLVAWAEQESELFLQGIETGRLAQLLNRLYDAESVADLDSLANWHVGEYIASGGSLMWFAGMVKAVAKQHLNRLGSRAGKLRCPCPGARYYLFPAAVGNREVPAGHVALDPACATAWVNDQDWLAYLVEVLGGCDGDDAVWVFPFRDTADQGRRKLLLWRSPNQVGEYVLLAPTAGSHELRWEVPGGSLTYPHMNSRLLPNRIDSCSYQYGHLTEASDQQVMPESYSIAAMTSTIRRAAANQGVLGAHCNALMLCKALYGRLPEHLPATLEAVIDGSVKSGLDLSPVQAWNQLALTRMVAHGQANPRRALPAVLLERLPPWLQSQAQVAAHHWLDTLAQALEQHKQQYGADVEALASEACPPLTLFEHGRDWLAVGKELRRLYSRPLRRAIQVQDELTATDFEAARTASETFLCQWPAGKRHCVLLGAAAYLYAQGPQGGEPVRDALLWQLGRPRMGEGSGREAGIAQAMLAALRQIGLLGEPVWTSEGAILHFRDEPVAQCAGVPVRISAVWFNWLRATRPETPSQMSLVPPAERAQAKARIADFVQERFRGLLLRTEVLESETGGLRVVTRTPQGNLFGYVQRDHELAAVRHDQWRIAWAHAIDGNVLAVLEPAG